MTSNSDLQQLIYLRDTIDIVYKLFKRSDMRDNIDVVVFYHTSNVQIAEWLTEMDALLPRIEAQLEDKI